MAAREATAEDKGQPGNRFDRGISNGRWARRRVLGSPHAWQTCRVPATRARCLCLIVLAGILVTGAGCTAGSTPGPPTPSVTTSSATTSADGNRSALCTASSEGPPTGGTQYGEEVEHNETYQGYRLIVTSSEERPGSWTYRVDILCDGERHRLLSNTAEVRYASAEEARRAALSAAAGAIDRMRASRGKP